MIGYYGQSKFGGYLDYQINERWGVQTGVQTVQQVGTNRYQAEPIVTPYLQNQQKSIHRPAGRANSLPCFEKNKKCRQPIVTGCLHFIQIIG